MRGVLQAGHLGDGGFSQIGVQKQHPFASARKDHGQIHGHRAFSLSRDGTGNHIDLPRLVGGRLLGVLLHPVCQYTEALHKALIHTLLGHCQPVLRFFGALLHGDCGDVGQKLRAGFLLHVSGVARCFPGQGVEQTGGEEQPYSCRSADAGHPARVGPVGGTIRQLARLHDLHLSGAQNVLGHLRIILQHRVQNIIRHLGIAVPDRDGQQVGARDRRRGNGGFNFGDLQILCHHIAQQTAFDNVGKGIADLAGQRQLTGSLIGGDAVGHNDRGGGFVHGLIGQPSVEITGPCQQHCQHNTPYKEPSGSLHRKIQQSE